MRLYKNSIYTPPILEERLSHKAKSYCWKLLRLTRIEGLCLLIMRRMRLIRLLTLLKEEFGLLRRTFPLERESIVLLHRYPLCETQEAEHKEDDCRTKRHKETKLSHDNPQEENHPESKANRGYSNELLATVLRSVHTLIPSLKAHKDFKQLQEEEHQITISVTKSGGKCNVFLPFLCSSDLQKGS